MGHRTHERGVGMLNTPYVKKDTIKNFFPVPNAVFDLGLHHMEINIYAYLLRIEDRRTYQCIVSYPTIAKKLGISVNTVAKYVAALEEHGLIRTERTEIITKDGRKRNGCLRYTIMLKRHTQVALSSSASSFIALSRPQQRSSAISSTV